MQTKRRRRLTSSSKVSHSVVVIVIVMSHSGIDFFKQGQGELCRRNHLGRHKILPGSPISTASFITIVCTACTACTAQPMCVWMHPPARLLGHPLSHTHSHSQALWRPNRMQGRSKAPLATEKDDPGEAFRPWSSLAPVRLLVQLRRA